MKEREHVIGLLKRAKSATRSEDVVELKEISNKTIHSSTIYQDEDNILVAVVFYGLSKIIERGRKYYKENYQKYKKQYLKILDDAMQHLEKKEDKKFKQHVSKLIRSSMISEDLKQHLKDLFQKAKLNKAGKVYEHGISMEKTAKLLGVSQWELAEYTGQIKTGEMKQEETMNIQKRIKLAEEIFK